jgi:hypothetical protein
MASMKRNRIAIVWRGDRETRRSATPQNNRVHRIFEALETLGIQVFTRSRRFMPLISLTRFARSFWRSMVCSSGSIRSMRGKPEPGSTRCCAMLRDVASRGPWVSAHPEVILKMGVKEVLHRPKHLAAHHAWCRRRTVSGTQGKNGYRMAATG